MKYLKRSAILFISLMLTGFCAKKPEKITYKPIAIENPVTQFVTEEVFTADAIMKYQNNVFFVSYPDVWVADIDKKEMRLLFKKGVGPNEVYWANRLLPYKNEIYINSLWPLKHIYHFSPDSKDLVLQKLEIPTATSSDDFLFLSPDQLTMVNAQWEEGDLVRIYDLKTGKHQSICERTYTPIMRKFNVNIASICALGDRIYVIQTITPEIQVISIPDLKVSDKIKLSPPFYKPMPAEYKINPLDRKQHLAWHGRWTSLYDISGKDNWLLVTYQTWIEEEKRYYYELINLKDSSDRFFIEQTPYLVYDFEISGEKMHMDMCEEKGERIRWLTAGTHLH